jgi:hypothetical protein
MEIKIIDDILLAEERHTHVYFSRSYLTSQNHNQFISYETNNLQLMVVVSNNLAISMPRSPFGSFYSNNKVDVQQFDEFVESVKKDLEQRGISQLIIHHPSSFYSGFVPESHLERLGFISTYSDINQHIVLQEGWKNNLHKMQLRKLKALEEEGFQFKKMDGELEVAHQFISACRQVQGLTVNIEWDHLKKLNDETDAYDCFGVFRNNKLSCVCITVKVSDEVAYYYLPATSPTFRTESPMVMLIVGIADYYMDKGFSYFDMGVSSVMGKPQESLILFKERMGAETKPKNTWTLTI